MPHFWDDKFWERSVHLLFSEQLYVFLVRTKPFRPEALVRELNRINHDLKLGGVRTFKILGPHDLLIRAWLHHRTEAAFIERLKKLPNYKSHHPFKVESLESRWWSDLDDVSLDPERSQLIAELDHAKVDAIESGRDMIAFEDYRKRGLILERPPLGTITFFIAVNFDAGPLDDELVSIVTKLREYIHKELKGLQRVTIDRGTGFCQILIKGESGDFFEIGKLPGWIGEAFNTSQVVTETYLSHGRDHIAGDERLSTATLDWTGGFDPFARLVLPELYPKGREKSREEIERFLLDDRDLMVTNGQRVFLGKFLLGVLEKHSSVLAQALFLLFWDLEGFLSKNCAQFFGRLGVDMGKTMQDCNVREPKHPNLMDLLQIYTKALQLKEIEVNPSGEGTKGWNDLVDLRNYTNHNKGNPLENWKQIAETALRYWKYVLRLAEEIVKVNGGRFEGTFWP
jgi:hypothetical protein